MRKPECDRLISSRYADRCSKADIITHLNMSAESVSLVLPNKTFSLVVVQYVDIIATLTEEIVLLQLYR